MKTVVLFNGFKVTTAAANIVGNYLAIGSGLYLIAVIL